MSAITESNKALVRRIFDEVWNQGNLAAAGEIFAEPQGVETFVGGFLQAFPDVQHQVEEMLAEGDRVAARFSAAGTHRGRWKDFPATGISIRYSGVTIARVEGGRITSHHTWWDSQALLEQIQSAEG